jgi:hypothetical protein
MDLVVLLHLATGVGEKRPLSADRGAELVGFQNVVGRDRDDPGLNDRDLGIAGSAPDVPSALSAEVAPPQNEDDRIDPLQLTQRAPLLVWSVSS